MTTTITSVDLVHTSIEAANGDYRQTRLYYMASDAVICPTCRRGFGQECQSTGGGNFTLVPTHKARRTRIADWSTEQRHTYGELVFQYRRSPWDAPAELVAEAEAAAKPIPAKDAKQPTPRGVRLSEKQAEEIERAAESGGKTWASTAHFHGDHQERQTVLSLVAKGIFSEGALSGDGYSRDYSLTDYGWQVYRQHRLVIRRLTCAQVDALIAQQQSTVRKAA
ncbi:hypothetical protein BDK92_7092 [Micromonospora pisi]|uniref:Uncharacterized protein n=1 Tax=Micromonospora pisi TaxID=589240 RepID=A0A495JUH0_9ACTN|nr:hypothetical protein [Micromonospora pisi]RKR92650.1 hypothetical protein BDK92_7092 [Micromonospora pisi]